MHCPRLRNSLGRHKPPIKSSRKMIDGHIAELPRRGVVSVSGPDAETFLDGLVTNDVTGLAQGSAGYGALLTPQGKILFDFVVFRDGERFLFDRPTAAVPYFVKRLGFYKLRADVEIQDLSQSHRVAAAWGSPQPPQITGTLAVDPRLKSLGFRMIVAADQALPVGGYASADEADYDAHRIAAGIPEGEVDFAYGQSFPHDIDMDQLAGIAFDKGCYIGQEVVSRMEHRGTARRRMVQILAASPIPPAGAEITADETPVGVIASSSEHAGLAMVRLDRAKAAIEAGTPLLARGMPVEISIPDWADFGLSDANSDQ
jgi:folate-binding protein YgfZ